MPSKRELLTSIAALEAENKAMAASILAIHDSPRGDVITLQEEMHKAEAELATVNALLDMKREREQHWEDEAWKYKQRAEQAEAELAALTEKE